MGSTPITRSQGQNKCPRPHNAIKLFPWGHIALGKAAMKLHVGSDHRGYLPAFATITGARTADIEAGRILKLPAGSIVVLGKGYDDCDSSELITQTVSELVWP